MIYKMETKHEVKMIIHEMEVIYEMGMMKILMKITKLIQMMN